MDTTIVWCCALIAFGIFGVMIYSIATFPASKNAAPATYRHSRVVEIAWALIPIAIIIGAALPATRLIGSAQVTVAGTTASTSGRN
jgi:cytochrome c oxidase subunit 2